VLIYPSDNRVVKMFNTIFHRSFVILIWIASFFILQSPIFSQTLILNKNVDQTQIETGREFVYTLQYTCASTTQNCENVVLLDTLPAGLEFISFMNNPLHSSNTTYDSNTRVVSFELNKENGTGMDAGSTGEVFIQVRFPNGSTPDGFTVENSATITANGIPDGNSNMVATEAEAQPTWTVDKSNADGNTIFLDADFTYQIEVDDALNGDFGSLNLLNYSLIDALPAGAIFVNATDGGIYNMTTETVTWNFGNLTINNGNSVEVTVRFPSSDFMAGDLVVNSVDLIGQPVGESSGLLDEDDITHTLQAPNADGEIEKDLLGDGTFLLGDTIQWEIDVDNIGTTLLDNFVFYDTIPAELDLWQLTTGRYNNAPTTINISYQTTNNAVYTTYPGSPFNGSSKVSLK